MATHGRDNIDSPYSHANRGYWTDGEESFRAPSERTLSEYTVSVSPALSLRYLLYPYTLCILNCITFIDKQRTNVPSERAIAQIETRSPLRNEWRRSKTVGPVERSANKGATEGSVGTQLRSRRRHGQRHLRDKRRVQGAIGDKVS